MKYQANPVIVEAFKIKGIQQNAEYDCIDLLLDNGDTVRALPEMTSRMTPKIGDYWVIQEDSYVYINPKDVFERKYSPINQPQQQGA